jgi:hypothetical protein
MIIVKKNLTICLFYCVLMCILWQKVFMSEKKKKQIRLVDVSEKAYLILLEFKAKESQRLKRACNLTDGFERMAREAASKEVEVTIGEPCLSISIPKP